MQRRCLQLQLQRLNLSPDFQTVEWLREKPNCPISINPVLSVCRDQAGSILTLTAKQPEFRSDETRVVLKGNAGETVFNGVRCRCRLASSRTSSSREPRKQCE
jgi:hypothetical protein